MHTALYHGWVSHRRHAPRAHEFRYPLFMVLLDLDELPEAFDGLPGWSARGPSLAWFRRADHYGDSSVSLRATIEHLVQQTLGRPVAGAIRLLTHLRYFGHCFNPISCYYCYDAADELDVVVAEVNNTWGQRHCYVLDRSEASSHPGGWWHWHTPKQLHVSPFMPIDLDYQWRFRDPRERLGLHMENRPRAQQGAGEALFDASLSLERQPLTAANARRVLLRFPLMTAQVIGSIHFEALKLWLKRTPLFPDPHIGRRKETPEIR
ncbi:MAG: DUF1365 domain-containing protein [Pseudomonadota bacterium]